MTGILSGQLRSQQRIKDFFRVLPAHCQQLLMVQPLLCTPSLAFPPNVSVVLSLSSSKTPIMWTLPYTEQHLNMG